MNQNAATAEREPEVDPTGWMPTLAETQAEQAVLGAMLWASEFGGRQSNSPAIDVVSAVLTPEHLFRHAHREVMQAILDMDAEGRPVDALTVAGELEARQALQRVGGAPYLHSLLASVPTVANAGHYADIVKSAATRRATIDFGKQLGQFAQPGVDTEDLLDVVERTHTSYLERVGGNVRTELRPAGDPAELQDLIDTWGEVPEGSFTTGIIDLDGVLNIGAGSLIVIAGKSGVGKSILSQTIVRHHALPSGRHEPALVFSMEMPRKQLQQRDLAAMARVRSYTATGKTPLSAADRERLYRAAAEYAEATEYVIDDTKNVTLAHIRAGMRDMHRKCGRLGIVAIDYAGLVDLPKRDREDQALGELSRMCKVVAGEYDCIVLLLCQLNRKPDERVDGRPRMSDLRGSACLEHDADAIILLHDPGKLDEARLGELEVIVDKQRAGVSGRTITVADLRHQARIGDLAVDG